MFAPLKARRRHYIRRILILHSEGLHCFNFQCKKLDGRLLKFPTCAPADWRASLACTSSTKLERKSVEAMPNMLADIEDLLPRFAVLLAKTLGEEDVAKKVTLSTRPAEEFNLDSLASVSLMFLCEEEFKLDLAPYVGELVKLAQVDEFLLFIRSKGAA